jgi:phosphate transport system substrate-binding protein
MRLSLLSLFILCGCAPTPSTQTSPEVLRLAGSETLVQNLLPALTQTHKNTVGTFDFEIEGGGTALGIRRLLSGEADLAASSREPMPAEEEQALANGYALDESARHIIAVDGIAVAVHPTNPLQSLTYDQVIAVFCTLSIDNWASLGLDDAPIHVITREPTSGTRALFEDFFCGPKGIHYRVDEKGDQEISKALSSDALAISFVTTTETRGKILALRPEASGDPIAPSQQNIIRGAYPLYRDLTLFSAGEPTGNAASFLQWISSPAGQEVVDEARFVPLFLRPETLDDERPLRESIHFEPGSSRPNQRSLARLDLLVNDLRSRAGERRHIILEGYTDNREQEPTQLSEQRAAAVKTLLEKELPGLFYEIIPRGLVRPLAPNETPYGRQRNRRVQIYLAAEEKTPADAAEALEALEALEAPSEN